MEQVVKRRRPGLMIMLFGLVAAAIGAGMIVVYSPGSSESGRSQLGSDLAVEQTASDGSESTLSTTRSTTVATTEASAPTTTPVTTTVATSVTTATAADGGAGSSTTIEGDVRSYTMAGGEIVLTFLDDEVRLVTVTLNDGFTIETHEVGEELHINLRDGVRHSALVAWIDDGPQILLDDH